MKTKQTYIFLSTVQVLLIQKVMNLTLSFVLSGAILKKTKLG